MKTIAAYHRPTSLDEAVALLRRPDVNSAVVAGGTALNAAPLPIGSEVIDIQDVVSAGCSREGDRVVYGAMTRLSDLIECDETPPLLASLAKREGPNTIRNASTIGGTVAARDMESELLAGLLVHQATVRLHGSDDLVSVSSWMSGERALSNGIITEVSVAMGGETASARTGRTPADSSIVAVVGRNVQEGVLIAATGVAPTPVLVTDVESLDPPPDFRGSREYRLELARVLIDRVTAELGGVS